MLPNNKTDEYTRYCITPEGKEYLRRMLEEKNSDEDESDIEFELNMSEEIDFEDLKIFDDDDEEFEPDEDELLDDDFFRLNEERNDDAYDFWKETQ